MVRSAILSLMILFAPLPTGIWIEASGERREVPCPLDIDTEGPNRLPEGCKAPVPYVAYTRKAFVRLREEYAAIEAERDKFFKVAQEERAKRQELEEQFRQALTEFELSYNVLQSTCQDEVDCPVIKPTLTGAAIGVSICAGAWGASILQR